MKRQDSVQATGMTKGPMIMAMAAEARTPTNPLETLLTPDRQQELNGLTDSERHLFYGRVLESVFSNPTYQRVVFDTAAKEFDKMQRRSYSAGQQPSVEEIVKKVLKELGIT
jgi:hypothetical protein